MFLMFKREQTFFFISKEELQRKNLEMVMQYNHSPLSILQ